MSPKPHRILLDRVSSYADEAGAYLRRRRTTRKPFARVSYRGRAQRRLRAGHRGRAAPCSSPPRG